MADIISREDLNPNGRLIKFPFTNNALDPLHPNLKPQYILNHALLPLIPQDKRPDYLLVCHQQQAKLKNHLCITNS